MVETKPRALGMIDKRPGAWPCSLLESRPQMVSDLFSKGEDVRWWGRFQGGPRVPGLLCQARSNSLDFDGTQQTVRKKRHFLLL